MTQRAMSLARMLRREIGHGGNIPRGWRMAWYEPRRRVGVYAPAVFAWLLRILREVKHRVRLAWSAPSIERAQVFEMQRAHRRREEMAEEYARGYMQGWNECFAACLGVVEEELASSGVWDAGALLLPAPPKPEPPN
ncbi:MAG TPA: hypothetical protein VMU43_08120 [Candidatus Acidoferrum sp.]|nr:hypothetical protein [Candidatus Acidoferrum sp.]